MQWYEFLTPHQVEQIHETSLNMLDQIGVEFRYPPALEVLSKGGARIEGERVYFSPQLVESQIKKAPAQFTIHARNPDNNVVIGGDNIAFVPGYGAPFVTDLEKGRREGTLLDFQNFIKLTGALVQRHPFGGFKMSGVGSKAMGPDYLPQFMFSRTIVENTFRSGFAPM